MQRTSSMKGLLGGTKPRKHAIFYVPVLRLCLRHIAERPSFHFWRIIMTATTAATSSNMCSNNRIVNHRWRCLSAVQSVPCRGALIVSQARSDQPQRARIAAVHDCCWMNNYIRYAHARGRCSVDGQTRVGGTMVSFSDLCGTIVLSWFCVHKRTDLGLTVLTL